LFFSAGAVLAEPLLQQFCAVEAGAEGAELQELLLELPLPLLLFYFRSCL
jgi:hypothetical protein